MFLCFFIRISSAYLFTLANAVGCCGLVDGLYLFTVYALPLTMLCIAFGSDWHFSLPA